MKYTPWWKALISISTSACLKDISEKDILKVSLSNGVIAHARKFFPRNSIEYHRHISISSPRVPLMSRVLLICSAQFLISYLQCSEALTKPIFIFEKGKIVQFIIFDAFIAFLLSLHENIDEINLMFNFLVSYQVYTTVPWYIW